MTLNGYASLFLLELKRNLAYRVDFWTNLVLTFITEFTVLWFLWHSLYESSGASTIGGLTVRELIFYMTLMFFIRRAILARPLDVATDIYTGGLSRYLIYPRDYFAIKYTAQLAYTALLTIPLLVGVTATFYFGHHAGAFSISMTTSLKAGISLLIGHYLYFIVSLGIDVLAFWIDATWSTLVMWRLVVTLLGGAMFPLDFFSARCVRVLSFSPFPHVFSTPLRALLGQSIGTAWIVDTVVGVFWMAVLTVGVRMIHSRGLSRYTGVGW